ncbi:6-phosphofructokinase [Candidatus Calescamantes bacterium]|nr:6-phosphofructokinase [Candidatus Calescamantes bacterium]
MKKIVGILTGGGDAPGLNAVIWAVVKKGKEKGIEVVGIKDGWKGLINRESEVLTEDKVENIHRQGGTILGTSRTNPFKVEGGVDKVEENINQLGLYALIAVGGEDTLGVAEKLYQEKGLPIVGVPKTIDNDLSATDYTFGFDTAINIITESLDRLHTTAKSHHRVMIVEIMGRHAGWLTLYGGFSGGAHIIILPEEPFDLDEICQKVKERKAKGKDYTIIAVAEGAIPKKGQSFVTQSEGTDAFGHIRLGGIAKALEKEIQQRTGIETRHVILGHLQRGGSPSAFDRILGLRLGMKAVEIVAEGKFGCMVALKGTEIVDVPLKEAVGKLKVVPSSLISEFQSLL